MTYLVSGLLPAGLDGHLCVTGWGGLREDALDPADAGGGTSTT